MDYNYTQLSTVVGVYNIMYNNLLITLNAGKDTRLYLKKLYYVDTSQWV